ncbi:hypothetical protein [Halobacillus ihumii]|uniref:hypothetical protein n=1 Tax=Halobacillus ihumii TaxID=2686092 RepID=UPI0013D5D474|nr:hypothetical protein [Halobacillus ihumii]
MVQLTIETHSGHIFDVEVEDFDATVLNTKLNDETINSVEIGGLTRSRIDIKGVTPADIYNQEHK